MKDLYLYDEETLVEGLRNADARIIPVVWNLAKQRFSNKIYAQFKEDGMLVFGEALSDAILAVTANIQSGKYEERDSFFQYLYVVLKNKVNEKVKKEQRARTLPIKATNQQNAIEQPPFATSDSLPKNFKQLLQDMDLIPSRAFINWYYEKTPRDQKLLDMHYVHSFSREEIAKELDMTNHHVSVRLNQLNDQMKKITA